MASRLGYHMIIPPNITKYHQIPRQDAVDDSIGNSYAAIKFACHNAADPNQKGIMRIYIQTPIAMMDGDIVAIMDRQGLPSLFPPILNSVSQVDL